MMLNGQIINLIKFTRNRKGEDKYFCLHIGITIENLKAQHSFLKRYEYNKPVSEIEDSETLW